MQDGVALLHVHTHGGRGIPGFSGVDVRENAKFVPDFLEVAPQCVHGAIVLSDNAAYGHLAWPQGTAGRHRTPCRDRRADPQLEGSISRLDRQSFLAPDSDAILEAATVGIVG